MSPFLNEVWVWVTAHAAGLVALSALATSVFALVVSVGSLWQNRRHNILSVRPDLVFKIHLSDNKESVIINVCNCGLGPAVIDCMEAYNGKELMLGKYAEKIHNAVYKIFPNENPNKMHLLATWFADGVTILPNQSHDLLIMTVEEWTRSDYIGAAHEILDKFNIIIKYKCFYDTKFIANTQ